jgi:hypothetical protein
MGFIAAIWMLVLGVLGAANIIIAKRPDAKEAIDKLRPYQGWIGLISALWGAWIVIFSVLHIGWMSLAPLLWLTILAEGLLLISLGLLLGVGLMKSFIKQPEATQSMDSMVTKLAPYQGKLGLVAIVLGIWGVIASLTMHIV